MISACGSRIGEAVDAAMSGACVGLTMAVLARGIDVTGGVGKSVGVGDGDAARVEALGGGEGATETEGEGEGEGEGENEGGGEGEGDGDSEGLAGVLTVGAVVGGCVVGGTVVAVIGVNMQMHARSRER